LTGYDQQHLVTYLRLLDADAEGADWQTTKPEIDRARMQSRSHFSILELYNCNAFVAVPSDWIYPKALPPREIRGSAHFRPDRLTFQDSVATSAGLQPFDPAAA
jgi:hypothetical protein